MKKIISIIAVAVFLFAGCAKEGLGGDATLAVFPQHHGAAIYSTATYKDSVFIKFNAKEIPADPTHDYDALFVGEVGENHIHCEELKWGDYSVFCTGWDTTINQRVKGGILTKIKRKDRKDEVDLEVPVTEE